MAQAQPIQFQLPVKGVVKGLAYSDHPPEAAIDALNVLPFDSTGRMRLAPRPGTAKLWAASLAANPMQGLWQTILALDPTTVAASTQLATDAFTYANGNLSAVAANWDTRQGTAYSTSMAGTQTAGTFQIATNKVSPATGFNGQSARYTPTLTLGAAYVVKIDATIVANTGALALTCRVNPTGPTGATAVSLFVQPSASAPAVTLRIGQEAIVNGGNSLTLPDGFFVIGTTYTLEIRVNGDFISGWVNGVKYVSRTTTSNNAFSGFAFGAESSISQNATFDNFFVYTGASLASYRQTNLIAVAGGSVYVGDIATQGVVATAGAGVKSNTGLCSLASIFGKCYVADGRTNLKVLDLTTRIVADWASSAGTETAATLGQYQLAAVYRGRLVLAADRLNPQNFVLSRVGVPTDFNYAATDVATAFAGNASKAGQIGEPIVALMPFSDDVMLIGGDHNLWAMRGDPADGGSIDLVSDAVGILGKDAWTKSPDGTIYFVGTGGLFRMSPQGSVPECISDAKVNEFFRAINRGTQYVTLAWDRDRHQLFVFIVPVNTGVATSIVWDQRTEGFWPIQYPDSHGPLCALVYDGDGPTDRTTLLGGRTGYVQQITPALNDDGTAISSYVYLGPQRVDDSTDAVLDALEVVMGKSPTTDADWNCVLAIVAGQTVEQAFTAPLHTRTKTQTAGGRQSWWYPKVRGNSFFLKIANTTLNKTWNFERAAGQMTASSPVRRKV